MRLTDRRFSAVLLAAGASTRMGQTKALLPLGGHTVIEQVVESLRAGGVADIVGVTGHHGDILQPVLQQVGIRVATNPHPDRGMFSSVQTGVRALDPETVAFFLLPVDIPLVRPWTLRYLTDWFDPDAPRIVNPCFQGRPGHPPLLPFRLVPSILAERGPGDGLRSLLEEQEAIDVEVPDRNVLFDIDSPADYRELCRRWERNDVPTPEECDIILTRIYPVTAAVRAHSLKVAQVADKLARALVQAGESLDLEMLRAAALLHDLAKGRENHAAEVRRVLEQLGFAGTAAVAGAHMDLSMDPTLVIDEAAVLYLADKMVQRDRLIPLEKRFEGALQRFGDAAAACRRIRQRRRQARQVRDHIEQLVGTSLESILGQG